MGHVQTLLPLSLLDLLVLVGLPHPRWPPPQRQIVSWSHSLCFYLCPRAGLASTLFSFPRIHQNRVHAHHLALRLSHPDESPTWRRCTADLVKLFDNYGIVR